MPEKETLRRARKDAREGKSASTQAGEFVREEIRHVREGKHGARSTKQAIAVGLSKARRAGVPLAPPASGRSSTKKSARSALKAGKQKRRANPRRARGARKALRRFGRKAASRGALSRQARKSASRRRPAERRAAARKAARTRARRGR